MMHDVFQLLFDRLILAPVPSPRRVLDCGSGSASWVEEVAEQYPECEVCCVQIDLGRPARLGHMLMLPCPLARSSASTYIRIETPTSYRPTWSSR